MSIKIQNSKQIKNERNWKVSRQCYSVQPVSLVPGCTGGRAVAHAEVCNDDDDDDNTLIEGIQLPPGHEPGDHFQLRPHSHHLPYRKMLEPAYSA